MNINVKLTDDYAQLPKRSNPTDAGADLFSPIDVTIPKGGAVFINLHIQTEIPVGYVGMLFARSGLGSKGLRPRNGTGIIDSRYRGDIGVMLENVGDSDYEVSRGDRIVQLVIVPMALAEFTATTELNMEDDRCGGFGSSGR